MKIWDFDESSPHRCEICGMRFRTSTQLLHHSYHHSDSWPFKCHLCQTSFPTQFWLKKHFRTKTVQCNNCSVSFQEKFCSGWPPRRLHEMSN
ncbi:hypothetical protein TNIN_105791 [Trichonephila inaurata madagascariensis]|uniref:C2H2-type domain-containing protein n=1 Tax=Trichonephila inaurata madagascariensis TaxID=2747483 RepID=A0A8X6XZG8_9ARAC|nr:hypothetical protein TNIN_105791 [Trichonephila inaurata madagascariensis]